MRGRHMKMKTEWSGWGYMAILYHFINRGTQNTDTLLNTLKYSGTTMNNRAGLMHANPAVTWDEQTYISTKKPSNTGRTKLDKATSYFRASNASVTWVKIRQHLLCIYRLQHVVTKASFQLAPTQLGSTRFLGFSDQKQIVSLNPFDHVSQRSQTDCLKATFMAGFSHSVGILDDFISRVG